MDVSNAFLHGKLFEAVYMKQPFGFEDFHVSSYVCKLNKAIYGPKQSPQNWFSTLSKYLKELGFHQSKVDSAFHIYCVGTNVIYFLVYVDDILLSGNNQDAIFDVISKLKGHFKMKDLGHVSKFLGISAIYKDNGLQLSQTDYEIASLKREGTRMIDYHSAPMPLPPKSIPQDTDQLPYEHPKHYCQLIGALQYLTITRSNISFTVNRLCQLMHAPKLLHLKHLKRIFQYIKAALKLNIMQEARPLAKALAATHCKDDTTSRQSPSKRKASPHSQSKQGNSSSQMTPSSRYTRSQATPDWTVQEVLVLLSEIVAIDEAWLKELSSYQRWKMISDNCIAMDVVRSSNQCKRKWEMLHVDYNKIVNWELQSGEDSYWFLPEERRKDCGLPVSFQKEIFDAIDAVIQVHRQQSYTSNRDPERLISGSKFERSKMKTGSVHEEEVITIKSPEKALVLAGNELISNSKSKEVEKLILENQEKFLLLASGNELIGTSKSTEVEKLILNNQEKAHVLASGNELISTSKITEAEKLILENQEKVLMLTSGNELITTSKSHEAGELITTSKNFTERAEMEELNTSAKNLEERPDPEELITTSKKPNAEEPVTTSTSSEQKLQVQERNTTLKSLEEIPELEEQITASKSPEMEELITAFKNPEVEELNTSTKGPYHVSQEEGFNTSKNSVVDELITAKSSKKRSVLTAIQHKESITNSKRSEKTRSITGKLQENAEHVCAILRGELQKSVTQNPLPTDSLNPSAAETQFARHQADELIQALAELTKSLNELSDHIDRRGCVEIMPVDSMA